MPREAAAQSVLESILVTSSRHQLTVFGATSFVGQILTRDLVGRHGVGGELDWAIAGRSKKKLEALRNMERDLLRDRIRSGGGGGGGGSSGSGGGGGGS